ncbi:hypothetical protein [uncultured Eubacterium sp.]|mgnify:FL=1|uniref:hypothetical protein n=1 Tax=uncultured Eubacterium sp. TaxID=165185 RepID=UPI00258E6D0A|nr:hypothetical protein [uncultured Eubacterium sp.]
MKNIPKILLSVVLAVTLAFSFSSCSKSVELTEENVIETVAVVEESLKKFDSKKLEKYVKSSTLSTIMRYAKEHKQFKELGKAIFSGLSITVDDVDIKNQTVTVTVKNKDLSSVASDFAEKLKNNYSAVELLNKLDDDDFLDFSLNQLVESMDAVDDETEVTVTLNVKKGDKNLVLTFDDDSEDAVSGGALTAIKNIYK